MDAILTWKCVSNSQLDENYTGKREVIRLYFVSNLSLWHKPLFLFSKISVDHRQVVYDAAQTKGVLLTRKNINNPID